MPAASSLRAAALPLRDFVAAPVQAFIFACFGAARGGAGAGASLRARLPARRGAAASSPSLSSPSVCVISVTPFASFVAFAFATNLFRGDVSRSFSFLGFRTRQRSFFVFRRPAWNDSTVHIMMARGAQRQTMVRCSSAPKNDRWAPVRSSPTGARRTKQTGQRRLKVEFSRAR